MTKKQVHVIVQRSEPLTESEVKAAFKVSDQTQWYRALLQVIEANRGIWLVNAGACAQSNNPLAMAWNNGGENALSQLTAILEDYRKSEKD